MTPSIEAYRHVRAATLRLVDGLADADLTPQSADFASPGKWQLAHTTWFFEQFVLAAHGTGYRRFDERFGFLFNSYYNAVGARHERPRRGLLTRPTLADVLAWRAHVDHAMADFLGGPVADDVGALVELGLHHEQQHQELILTDLLHLFAQNPLRPAVRAAVVADNAPPVPAASGWVGFEGGNVEVGHVGHGFAFDNESPRHVVALRPFRLATRPVTNREWVAFVEAGGYADPALWLSDGWDTVQAQHWQAPLYWEAADDGRARMQMTLAGLQPLALDAPVAHVELLRGRRLRALGRQAAAHRVRVGTGGTRPAGRGQFRRRVAGPAGRGARRRGPATDVRRRLGMDGESVRRLPRLRAAPGAVGEYNGKFMNGQYVLRGGSCASPRSHLRASYRNFFQPGQRWQFSGLRLAEDA